jgi:hypothetical protein
VSAIIDPVGIDDAAYDLAVTNHFIHADHPKIVRRHIRNWENIVGDAGPEKIIWIGVRHFLSISAQFSHFNDGVFGNNIGINPQPVRGGVSDILEKKDELYGVLRNFFGLNFRNTDPRPSIESLNGQSSFQRLVSLIPDINQPKRKDGEQPGETNDWVAPLAFLICIIGVASMFTRHAYLFLPLYALAMATLLFDHAPASLNRRSENIVVKPIVVPELKFRNMQRQVFATDLVETAHYSAFKDALYSTVLRD